MTRQFILTEDGSHTIFVPELGEHYHSIHGAIQESRHIFINNGYDRMDIAAISILEIGFGTGLNAFLTVLKSQNDQKSVHYETWEAYPLSEDESRQLNYPEVLHSGQEIFNMLHQSEWGKEVPVTSLFTLKKVKEDIGNFNSERIYDLVYYDAFGPDYQPELWKTSIFEKIFECMRENSRLVTYSAKGQVRRNLREAGFAVEKAPGPPGKREITLAIKK